MLLAPRCTALVRSCLVPSTWLPPAPRFAILLGVLLPLTALIMSPALAKGPRYIDPKKADADYAVQGEYAGAIRVDGEEVKLGVQVIALGKGTFRSVGYIGGLPGAGWNGEAKHETEGSRNDDGVVFFKGEHADGRITKNKVEVLSKEGDVLGTLKRVERTSETLGKKPPAGAVILFDGTDADQFEGGKVSEDGLLMEGTTSKPRFTDHKLHLEFRLPYQPEDRGQGRANSGVYLQGRYEVQMLDSFGLSGEQNECGGIYSVKKPDLNMCLPPLTWQTYDIEFTAARYDDDGKLKTNPRMSVWHNGVKIHSDVELPGDRSTTAGPVKPGPQPGPVYLQNHGCPVRYRNIWVVETAKK